MFTAITSTTLRWATATAALSALLIQSGCASDCAKMRAQYEQAATASPFAALGEARPIHVGVAVRDELLNEVLDRALRRGLQQGLSLTEEVSLATGQSVKLTTEGDVADLGLFPDTACDACLRVDGRLGGALNVTLPLIGAQKVPLDGSFSLVAPVRFAATDDGRTSVVLDLQEAHNVARSKVTPEVTHLPPTWWKVLKSPLSKALGNALLKDLPPVTLFTFEGFDFGVDGLEVVPAKIVSDPEQGVVFAGFTTNIANVRGELAPRTNLGKNDNLAIGITPDALGGLTAALLQSGKVPRTWSDDGNPDAAGKIHVTSPRVALTDTANLETTFRAWNLPQEGKCAWGDVQAVGQLSGADGGGVQVSVEDATLTDTSLPGVLDMVVTWRASKLLSAAEQSLSRTITPDAVNLAGHDVSMRRSRVVVDQGGVWLSGTVGGEPAE